MRPIKLEIEGFTSFRDRTVIDFTDTDLFVLTGPTGSGKSSVIDAITFALYGSIPRLDNRNQVAPVMSRGLLQTLVRLKFAIGENEYTVVRQLRAGKGGGASTSEARLEDGNENTLAANERELTEEVESLLGIPFDHFIKCVVLPQGDFADFMHARPADRQRFLIDLLGLDLYDQVSQRASTRKSDFEGRLAATREQIKRLEQNGHSEDALKAAKERIKDVRDVREQIAAKGPKLEELAEQIRVAVDRIKSADGNKDKLAAVQKPEGVDDLADQIRDASEAAEKAKELCDAAVRARQLADDALEALPDEAQTRGTIQKHEGLSDGRTKRTDVAEQVAASQKVVEQALEKREAAAEAVQEALAAREQVRKQHLAYHLAEDLEAGEPCPICFRALDESPVHEVPDDEKTAQKKLSEAQTSEQSCVKGLSASERDLAVLQERLDQLDSVIETLEGELKDEKTEEELGADLKAIEDAKTEAASARAKERKAQEELKVAETKKEEFESAANEVWDVFQEIRDSVAELSPPQPKRDDLSASWDDLVAWAKTAVKEQDALRDLAEKEREKANIESEEINAEIETLCAGISLEVEDGDALASCAAEIARQEGQVEAIQNTLNELKELRAGIADLEKSARTAGELNRLLSATQFKRWLMGRVLGQLSETASRILRELSSDSYSLAVDGRGNFNVIDHRNADEQRGIRTLSGGETFLASLSLALSLSEHLADIAVAGSAKLEALFLDEGFGTLDADTLDVVTTAIEELGARGRMIGIVTHVKDLAERIPVRYEVTKEGNRSSVERVVA